MANQNQGQSQGQGQNQSSQGQSQSQGCSTQGQSSSQMSSQSQGQGQGNQGTVAVEPNLSTVRDYLSNQGYNVVDFHATQATGQGYDAIVISGADKNVMGVQAATNTVPVINAEGMTPQDVAKRIQQTPQQS